MDKLNYTVLILGLIAISVFWNIIGPKVRRKETLVVTVCLSILGIVVYFIQSTYFPH